ncbi:MAG: TlpA family protein disulfide reductase [Dysgonamonadaceae bacterium]|jgi:thiol-disulfide isomerase/thioredoxin|nr:TlpA family protein disulfide reductase [Dysgonamonadaceae bacterium]
MKRFSFAVLCVLALSVFGCKEKRPAVVEQPVFESWNSDIIQIEKIELSDTATVMYVHAFCQPGEWIKIDKESYIRKSRSDEKWFVTKSEGIELSEEFEIPDSGKATFKLIFPPLPSEVTAIDFIESDCEECFKIWGIHLLPGSKVTLTPFPKERKAEEPLPDPAYSSQPATISGKLFGYVKGEGPETVNIYYMNLLNAEQITAELPVAADGSFSGEVAIGFPSIVASSLGSLFLTPGKELKIFTDLKKKSRYESKFRADKAPGDSLYQYFEGSPVSFAALNTLDAERLITDREEFYDNITRLTADEYKSYLLDLLKEKSDKIKQSNLPAHVRLLTENSLKLEVINRLLLYELFIAQREASPIYAQTKATPDPQKPGKEYYSILSELISDELSYLSHFVLIESIIRQSSFFNISGGNHQSPEVKFALFKEKAELLGIGSGIFLDLAQMQIYGEQIQKMQFYTEAEKEAIKNAFRHHPEYAQRLIEENDRLKKETEANQNNPGIVVNPTPNVPDDKLFDAIIAKYKGKVVVVDFWATWCAPCLQAMETIKPLKTDLQQQGVVFLYLTGETSPVSAWNKKISDIHGEHYRVSGNQWMHWSQQFGIQGIPYYMIYDKNGKQILKQAGFPGNDALGKTIKPLL